MTHYPGDDPLADTQFGHALTRAIVDTIHEPFLVLDTDLRIIVASRSFYKKFQVAQHDIQGQLLYEIEDGAYDIPALRHFLKKIVPEHAVLFEYKIVHDFEKVGKRTLLLSAREVLYENSARKHLLLTMSDISGQELLDAETARLTKEKDLMIKELKHRMANSLQLIASILILKSEVVDSPEVRTHLKDAHARIMSIATVEKFLDTTSLSEEVEVGPYLTGLCKSLSATMISPSQHIDLTVDADGGMVNSSDGISLGLITAELVINSLKHAFPGRNKGTIVVTYTVQEANWKLTVRDDGIGIKHDPARKEGLGTTIVQSLSRQLGAMMDIQTGPEGTTVSISSLPKPVKSPLVSGVQH